MTKAEQDWIDKAGYPQLLHRWRHSAIGDEIFKGDTGEYYAAVMKEKRESIGNNAAVAASKSVGWEMILPAQRTPPILDEV
jgi:hypothetical protein